MHLKLYKSKTLTFTKSAYKYCDINAGIAKFYCYSPSQQNKNEMRRGIGGINTEEERPELNEHYALAKAKFKGEIGFCTECGDPRCALNRYECHRMTATSEFLMRIRNVPK